MLNILKKDLLLIKDRLFINFVLVACMMLYLGNKIDNISGFFVIFMLTFFLEYLVFYSAMQTEEKYKGNIYLCATSYTCSKLLLSKYIFYNIILFASVALSFLFTLFNSKSSSISFSQIAIIFFVQNIACAVSLPLIYKYSFEKLSFLITTLNVMLPVMIMFGLRKIFDQELYNHINGFYILGLILLTFLLSSISYALTKKIYLKKDLWWKIFQ